jgi:hypothetical protein
MARVPCSSISPSVADVSHSFMNVPSQLNFVLAMPNNELCFIVANNTAEECVTPLHGEFHLENWVTQDICCNNFRLVFLAANHTMDSLCFNIASLCVCVCIYIYV